MPVTASWYGVPLKNLFDGTIAQVDWDTNTIKVSLHTATYTPAKDTDDFQNDATNEITGTGYTADGVTLGTKTVQYNTASDEIRLDAADASWTGASFTARIAACYKELGGADSANPLIFYVDFGGNETVSSGTFTIQWAANGCAIIDIT